MDKDAILEKLKSLQGKALPALKKSFSILQDKAQDGYSFTKSFIQNATFERRFELKSFAYVSGGLVGAFLLLYLLSGFGNSAVITAHQERLSTQFYTVFVPPPPQEQEEEQITNPFAQFQPRDRAALSTLYYRFEGRWRPLMQEDGRTVFGAFSKDITIPKSQQTFNGSIASPNKARIAIVLTDVGINPETYETGIEALPKALSLAFSPYTKDLVSKIKRAYNAGFENWLVMPGEPVKYPFNDAGPRTILNNTETGVLIGQLEALIDDSPYVIGLVNERESTFPKDADKKDILPIFLHGAGMGYLSVTPSLNRNTAYLRNMSGMIPAEAATFLLDEDARAEAIQQKLKEAETIAKREGSLIIAARISPAVIDQIRNWVLTLPEKEIELTTASNMAGSTFMPYNPNYEVFDPEI